MKMCLWRRLQILRHGVEQQHQSMYSKIPNFEILISPLHLELTNFLFGRVIMFVSFENMLDYPNTSGTFGANIVVMCFFHIRLLN